MNNTKLMEAHSLLKGVIDRGRTPDESVYASFRILDEYVELIGLREKATGEYHKLFSSNGRDSVSLYIIPILNRMHAIEPTTPVKYSFDFNEEMDGILKLEIGPREFSDSSKSSLHDRELLRRSRQYIEAFISANKGSDGCVECGAGPGELCHATCSVLDATLLLASIERTL